MATRLTSPVKRVTGIVIDDGKARKLEVSLLPGDVLEFHLSGLKTSVVKTIQDVYEWASRGSDEFEPLTRALKFKTANDVKDGGKTAPLNITIYPDDTILVRHGAQGNAVSLSATSLYHKAVVKDANLVMPKARRK